MPRPYNNNFNNKFGMDNSKTLMYRDENDFNTEEDEFYPIVLDDDCVEGLSTTFYKGDNMPCRNIFCEIEIAKEKSVLEDL